MAKDTVLVTTIGWTALDGDTGVCAPCKRRPPTPRGGKARASAARIEVSSRAVAISKERIRQTRETRWHRFLVEQAARRLGFAAETCRACVADQQLEPSGHDADGHAGEACAACDGEGEVFRRGDTMVSRAGLLILSMRPS